MTNTLKEMKINCKIAEGKLVQLLYSCPSADGTAKGFVNNALASLSKLHEWIKLKSEEEYREKHLRVTATRVYLREVEGIAA